MKKPMRVVTIREARRQLSKLVEQASKGEPFIIAKGGKQLVKVTAIDASNSAGVRRLGFMAGLIAVPADFAEMGSAFIERIFEEE
jgi:prevent-host-death family protein